MSVLRSSTLISSLFINGAKIEKTDLVDMEIVDVLPADTLGM
jgi:hypothetical protein